LSIIFASIVLLFSAMSVFMLFAGQLFDKIGEMAPGKAGEREIFHLMKSIYTGMGLHGLILTIMSSALLAIGIGQLRYRAWARTWSIYWGIAAIASLGLMAVINVVYIGGAYERMLTAMASLNQSDQAIKNGMSGLGSFFGGAYTIMMVIFYAPYPILVLAFFTRPRVRLAMLS
jgi:hypothetical protein